jgi:hypothetical protein
MFGVGRFVTRFSTQRKGNVQGSTSNIQRPMNTGIRFSGCAKSDLGRRARPIGHRSASLLCTRSRAQPDVDLRCKRSVNGALRRDLHQLFVLFRIKRAGHFDLDIYPVEHAFFRFALFTIFCMNPGVPERYRDIFERPAVSARVETDSHGGANAEARQQIIVRIWAGITAASAEGLVSDKAMLTRNDFLFETVGVAAHDDVWCLVGTLYSHKPELGAQDTHERLAISPHEKDQQNRNDGGQRQTAGLH